MNRTELARAVAPPAQSLEHEIESVLQRLQQRRSSVASQHTALHVQLQAKMRIPRTLLLAMGIGLGFGVVHRVRSGTAPAKVPSDEAPAATGISRWLSTLLAVFNSVMALQALRNR